MSRAEVLERLDPELRGPARYIPLGLGIERRLRLQRVLSRLLSASGSVRGVEVARTTAGLPVRVHRPDRDTPLPAILWLHGGGTVIGSPAQDDRWCRRLAAEVGAVVVAPTYRLAPEHPFPAPVDDCLAALAWLADQPWLAPGRIAVAGASAGGLLAASVARRAQADGGPTLAALGLVYPMLDDRTGSPATGRRRLLWSEEDNQAGWSSYVGGADPGAAAPGRWEDLAGFPPTWVGVGTDDLFHDEDVAFAERLVACGVPTTLEVADGGYHGFDQISPDAAVSQRFTTSLVEHLRTGLAG